LTSDIAIESGGALKCIKCNSDLTLGERFCGACGTSRPASHARFIAVEENFLALKKRVRQGNISESEFTAELQKLILTDESGAQWMIGQESEQWHRFNGQEWILAELPGNSAESSQKGKGEQPSMKPDTLKGKRVGDTSSRRSRSERSADTKPLKKAGRGCLGISPGVLLNLAVICGALILLGVLFRQELVNKFVSIAVDQGWGQVIATENFSDFIQPTQSAALPTQGEAPIESASSGSEKGACPAANVQAGIPPDFIFSIEDSTEGDKYGFFRDKDEASLLMMGCSLPEYGNTLESETDGFLNYMSDVNWQEPVYGNSPVGPMAWAEGAFQNGDPVFAALVGPTRDGFMITFWGLGEKNDWEQTLAVFQQVVGSLEYVN